MKFLAGAAAVLLAIPALAWNATGHRIIAAIAYDRLTPRTRQRVDALLEQHPDYVLLTRDPVSDRPLGNTARARAAFLAASTWPDLIRQDPRFYDDTLADAIPAPLLAGFPDMARHTNWHFVNLPFSPDETPLQPAARPNAVTELTRLLREIGISNQAAYDLPWLMHLEGDLHQPLHAVNRFVRSLPEGDRGGNGVYVAAAPGLPGRTLHSFWDDLAGTNISDAYIARLAGEIARSYLERRGSPPSLGTPEAWADESFQIAIHDVYFSSATGSREHPLPLPPGYAARARQIARDRLAMAGFRLAGALEDGLNSPKK